MSVFKNLIAPFQKALIAKRLCPACTAPFDKQQKYPFGESLEMVICPCRRMFIYDRNTDTYRRATILEGERFLKEVQQ